MKKISFIFTVLLCSSCASFPPQTSTKNSELNQLPAGIVNLQPTYSLVDFNYMTSIEKLMDENSIPGLRMVFMEKGKVLWSKSYGVKDLESLEKVNENTVFSAASLSKPVAAVGALKLVEQDILDLDQDINRKLKGWKVPDNEYTQQKKVTLNNLIGHRSGFDRYVYSIYEPNEAMPTIEQMLAGQAPSNDLEARISYVPGQDQKYSNTGYLVIEKLIEDATGKPFESVLSELVLKPAAMKHSTFKQDLPQNLLAQTATGYSSNLLAYPHRVLPFKALGGLWTTPDDFAKFVSILIKDHHTNQNTLLPASITKKIFNRRESNSRFAFSLWNWKDDIVFRHTGHFRGFTSFVFGSVNKEQVLVVMTNGSDTQTLFHHLERAIADEYDWDYFRSQKNDRYHGEIPNYRHYKGVYVWQNNYVNFSPEENGLFMQINLEKYKLIPISKREFILPEKPLKIIFPEVIEGKVSEVVIYNQFSDYTKAIRQ